MGKFIDMTGQTFGRLTAVKVAGRRGKVLLWEFSCSCGNTTISTRGAVQSGNTSSCGCLRNEIAGARLRTHGKTCMAEYSVWEGIRRRCNNKNQSAYKNYGGRGISVAKEWDDFEVFLADMGARPSKNHSIERKEVDGDYTPQNCGWADRNTQAANIRKRSDNTSGFTGVLKIGDKWKARVRWKKDDHHVGTFDTPEEAATWRDAYIIANGWPHSLNFMRGLA